MTYKVLLVLSYVFSDWRELEVEHQDRLSAGLRLVVGHFVVGDKLVNVIFEQAFFEIAGHCHEVVHRFHLLGVSFIVLAGRSFDAIQWVFHIEVLELLRNVVEILLVAKTNMMDVITVIKLSTLHHERVGDVLISVCSDMEVTWDSKNLNIPLQSTPLSLIHLLLDPVHDGASELVGVHLRLF